MSFQGVFKKNKNPKTNVKPSKDEINLNMDYFQKMNVKPGQAYGFSRNVQKFKNPKMKVKPSKDEDKYEIKSFSKMKVNRIAVLTPYPKLVNETIYNFLLKHNIEITSFSSFNLEYDSDIANVDPQHLLETINNLEYQNADAIFVSCTALRAVEILDQAERDTSKFVISSNQALIWDTIRSVNINSNINGYGKLFLN